MDPTMYIAISIIALFILLGIAFSWVSASKKKKAKKNLIKEFNEFVEKNKLAIYKEQTLNKNMIGLDKLNSKLVFLEKDSSAKRFYLIDLHNLSSCRLIKKENVAQHICAIYLLCTFKDNSAKDIILPFYDEAKDKLYKMMRLSKKAHYWEESINIFRDAPLIHQ